MRTHRTGLSAAIALMVTGLFVTPALASERHGGNLTVAITGETIDTFDPLFGNRPTTEGAYMNLFYDTLVTLNKDGTYGPGLASSFDVDAGTGNIVFTIRDGVTFHDGTALDAEAVAWNLRRVTDPDAGGRWAEALAPISSIEVTGPMEVSIALSEPSPFVLFTLASSAGMMVSPAFVDANGPEALGRQAMGTGPFVFEEIQDGVGVTAMRNEAYWMTADNGDALPYLDSVNVRFIPQSSVALLELRTGNIAAIQDVSPNDFETVEAEETLRLIDTGKGAASHINFNHSLPPRNIFAPKAFPSKILVINRVTCAERPCSDSSFWPCSFLERRFWWRAWPIPRPRWHKRLPLPRQPRPGKPAFPPLWKSSSPLRPSPFTCVERTFLCPPLCGKKIPPLPWNGN